MTVNLAPFDFFDCFSEAVNRAVLASAKQDKLESGATVRIDSTVTAALIHEPSDSALLWDAVRLMTRLLRQATALPGAPTLHWRDRRPPSASGWPGRLLQAREVEREDQREKGLEQTEEVPRSAVSKQSPRLKHRIALGAQ